MYPGLWPPFAAFCSYFGPYVGSLYPTETTILNLVIILAALSCKLANLVIVSVCFPCCQLSHSIPRSSQKQIGLYLTRLYFLSKVALIFYLNENLVFPSLCPTPKHPKEIVLHCLYIVRAISLPPKQQLISERQALKFFPPS